MNKLPPKSSIWGTLEYGLPPIWGVGGFKKYGIQEH